MTAACQHGHCIPVSNQSYLSVRWFMGRFNTAESLLQDDSSLPTGPGGDLYVGIPPAHPSTAFQALLAGQPSKETMRLMQAGLILEPGARGEPLLLLVLRGKPAITLRGGWAAFEKV